ncbi:zinc-binding dehydrogenase [Nordella sp. HKS 07]|uniref:quinone oxidoreductase family protein n=1 Tax=Nordella sp. HKS 07 TaxID=2712222 RepID=UPI0013E148ED|nr:zinc-binding dehydrogenase [Nordella sp. HKS 07]QIG49059.1 zinc-binding dehydrogenase [Nordella sp. HKS 07]
MRALVLPHTGGPEVFRWEEVATPEPGAGEVRIKVCYCGVNWGDIQKRLGNYPDPIAYPAIIGLEVSGHVDTVGPGVRGVKIGAPVAAITGPRMLGGYAEYCVVPADYVINLSAGIDLKLAAAIPAASITAWHLLNTAYPLRRGETILIHAIGGAVGLMLTQIASAKGARVIGTVGSAGKAEGPLKLGAAHVIDRSRQDFVAEVMRLTDGRGVDLVIDSLGADILERSFDVLRYFGRLINIGEAAGDPHFNIRAKLYQRSTSMAGFEFLHARPGSAVWRRGIRAITEGLVMGKLTLPIEAILPLPEAGKAHELLASRTVSGKLLLEVS